MVGYFAAVAAVATAALVRTALEPLTGIGAPWVTFFTAVVVVVMFFGRGPALVATFLSAIVGVGLFVLPAGYSRANMIYQASLWIIDGVILSHLASLLARRRAQAIASAAALRRSEERLRLATDAAHVGSYDIDVATHTVIGSPELHAVLGTPSEKRSLPITFETVHPDDVETLRAAFERSLDPAGDARIDIETRIVRSDGSPRWISWVGSTQFDDTRQGRVALRQVGVAVDITARRLAELELRELNENKDAFLAHLSHELRNPLAAIRAAISVLEHVAPNTTAAARARRAIDRQVTQLTRLIDDLLDVTRIARGKLVLRRGHIEIGDLVSRVVEDQRALIDKHGLELALVREDAGDAVWVDGDAARLTQVLHNLIHNAIKFTPAGGRITVAFGRQDATVVLRVRDTGSGMPPEEASRIFEPFVQLASSHARGESGLGIGLALVKGIVEQHGGSVVASSAGPGRGTELTVRLPTVAGPEPREATPSPPVPAVGRRVLLIDDHPDILETMRDVLELIGYAVRTASTGREGVAIANELVPDLVLCDIGLPDIDGYEVARQLRRNDALHDTVLVALTGYGQVEDRERARQAGFSRLVTKPATLDVLRSLFASAA
jgi:two-component system CheB/CheR fusion protein